MTEPIPFFRALIVAAGLAAGSLAPIGCASNAAGRGTSAEAAAGAMESVVFPMERLGTGHLMVTADVQGRPLSLLVDTGASTSVLTPESADELELSFRAGGASGMGAGGGLGKIKVTLLEGLSLGTRDYDPFLVAVMDLSSLAEKFDTQVHGILGNNFLRRHDLDADFPAGRLSFHPAGSSAGEPARIAAMKVAELGDFGMGIPRVEVSIDGGPAFPAVLDLGAATTVINEKAAAALGVPKGSELRRASPEPIMGADGSPMATESFDSRQVTLEDFPLAGGPITVADLPVFEALGVADEPAVILGHDQFISTRVLLDYQNGHVYLAGG